MSIAIPDIILTAHISSGNRARFELVVVMGLSNVASLRLTHKMGGWAMIKEMSDLLTDLALVVLLPIGYHKARRTMIESS